MKNQVAIFDHAGKECGVFEVNDLAFDALLSVSMSRVMIVNRSGETSRRVAVVAGPHPDFAQSRAYVAQYMEAAYAEPTGRRRARWWQRVLAGAR